MLPSHSLTVFAILLFLSAVQVESEELHLGKPASENVIRHLARIHPACNCTNGGPPLCGADGKTYGNGCLAHCSRALIRCRGKCPCSRHCNCPSRESPVCGTDGNTYLNVCVALCAIVRVAFWGHCRPPSPKP